MRHPQYSQIDQIGLVMLHGASSEAGIDGRNSVVMPNAVLDARDPCSWRGSLDRSPCGTGTSARMACLHARGQLPLGQPFVHQGVLGTTFTGILHELTTVGDFSAACRRSRAEHGSLVSTPTWLTRTIRFRRDTRSATSGPPHRLRAAQSATRPQELLALGLVGVLPSRRETAQLGRPHKRPSGIGERRLRRGSEGGDHAGRWRGCGGRPGQGLDVSAEVQPGHVDVAQAEAAEVGQAGDRRDSETRPDEAAYDVVVVAAIADVRGEAGGGAGSLEGQGARGSLSGGDPRGVREVGQRHRSRPGHSPRSGTSSRTGSVSSGVRTLPAGQLCGTRS